MLSKLISVFIFSVLILHANAQSGYFIGREITNYPSSILKQKFHSFKIIQLPSKQMAAYCSANNLKKNLQLQIGSGLAFNFYLTPSNLFAEDYKLQMLTPAGLQTIYSKPDFLFKGKTNNGGYVRLAIKEGFISGSIQENGKEYFIEPAKHYVTTARSDEFVVYEKEDIASEPINFSNDEQNELTDNNFNTRLTGIDSTATGVCRKVKILNATDYSIYQHYGGSVDAVENFLFANMNDVEGVYNDFNFNAADSSDTGKDSIQFEVVTNIISTCRTCDLTDSSNTVGTIFNQLVKFLAQAGYQSPYGFFVHCWTMRNIYALTPVAGETNGPLELLKHSQDDPLFLRVLAAHETGHSLGCPHDDQIKSDVTNFIMYRYANSNASRFSRLSDFGGINYSSNLRIKQTVLAGTFDDCSIPACENVMGINVQYYNGADSCRLSWNASGNVEVIYKLKTAIAFDSSTIKYTSDSSIVLKNLLPCNDYVVQVKKECSPDLFGPAAQVYIKSVYFRLTNILPQHRRDELYDLSCNIEGTNSLLAHITLTIDHQPAQFLYNETSKQLIINNLFADGARHRIDILNSDNDDFCSGPFYYTAPYYRDNSIKLLSADFNDCLVATGWSDSTVQVISNTAAQYAMAFGTSTIYTAQVPAGNIDSTCMAFCNNPTAIDNGKIYFISPSIDISAYTNTFLHFDYNFLSLKLLAFNFPDGVFSAEAYDGNKWNSIFSYKRFVVIKPLGFYNSVWDSLPQRKFISVDAYKNKDFKIRFIADDGSYLDSTGAVQRALITLALDNIGIDGYAKNAGNNNDSIAIYPNPAGDEIFVSSHFAATDIINYRMLDLLGRKLQYGQLINNRIDISHIHSRIFILQLFKNNKSLITRKLLKE